jgi:quercetin dioxygenase-like cupin family protein
MPVYNLKSIKDAQPWVDISAFGTVAMKNGQTVEPHYHDCEEFWFVVSGRARIRTEGMTLLVEKGDVVCTKMGDEHEVLEVPDEDFIVVWVESRLKGQKRSGHLHHKQGK